MESSPQSLGVILEDTTPTQDRPSSDKPLAPEPSVAAWEMLYANLGKRYIECRLHNFETYGSVEQQTAQKAAVDALTAYLDDFDANLDRGRNIVLYGPVGTGKDHLIVACLRRSFLNTSGSAAWVNGVDLFGKIRDAMGGELKESSLIAEFTKPKVLAISDPVPPWGDITEFQASTLFRIIDRRYRDCRPTFVTLNVKDGAEAEKRLTHQVVDRLRHGALSIHCNWTSFRSRV